ncbi:MAG: alpha/beta fold hydrolase [Sandaracinaceae bacterium]|nr:alpha/beta fold hydrolase [Myxococcales bacterium]MCB9657160.1 alpha/beta fold hydrolase [Sandaracinaceae bacterium]
MDTMRRWRGLKALIHDAVDATVDLVREGHESTSRGVMRVTDELGSLEKPARAVDGLRRVATDGVLGTIKVVNRAVEALSDVGIDAASQLVLTARARDAASAPDGVVTGASRAVPMRSDVLDSATWAADAALGLVNAAVGDHLHATQSGLDLGMELRAGDRYVSATAPALADALPDATTRVALFVHGLATTEWSWCLQSESYWGDPSVCFGTLLARDLGMTPLYIRYNTGRHISENGRQLASLLDELVSAYPAQPVELTLIGHSMGGLVLRSAAHYAERQGLAWPAHVKRVFYLGSPHQGAPLAKFGQMLTDAFDVVDLPATQILARILEKRSAGVQDLRHSPIVDEEWLAPNALPQDALPLPHATHHFVSATLTTDKEHPVSQLMGDLLVQVPSASGPKMKDSTFAIDTSHYGGVMHHELQNHPAVYEQVRRACAGGPVPKP